MLPENWCIHYFSTLLSCQIAWYQMLHSLLADCRILPLTTSVMQRYRFLICLTQSTMGYLILKNLHGLFLSFTRMPPLMIKLSVSF